MTDRKIEFEKRRASRGSFRAKTAEPRQDGSLFAWALFILLLIGLVCVCWMGSYYVFGHPEQPLSYSILHKFKKLEPPKRFLDTAAPKGEFLDAKTLLDRYGSMTPRQLRTESDKLLRNYIRNFKNNPDLVPYIIGRYNILDSYQLTKDDFFQSGVVALAQDSENPQILLEHVFTADERMIPPLHRSLLTGLDIPLHRTVDLSAIVGIERLKDGRLKFTAVPILYPGYAATQGPGSFSLEPPVHLNVEAGLPILREEKIAEADQRYAGYRRKIGLPTAPGETPSPSNELTRVQPATTADGEEAAPPVARALPVDSGTPPPAASAPEAGSVAGIPTPEPDVRPAVPLAPSTAPPLVEASPTPESAVPLKPFMGTTQQPPAAVASTTGGSWQTYAPGRMPRGRLVSLRETQELANRGVAAAGDRVYLQGDFVVTASHNNKAVLRAQSRSPFGNGGSKVRVIAEFPSGSRPPGDGANVTRDNSRPFLITDVQRAADGEINVYVREITSE